MTRQRAVVAAVVAATLLAVPLPGCSDAVPDGPDGPADASPSDVGGDLARPDRAADAPDTAGDLDVRDGGDDPADRLDLADGIIDALPPPPDRFSTFDDLPECDREQPDLACIRRLFLPLAGAPLPFDRATVTAALGENEFAVAAAWNMTAHHVLEGNLATGIYGCFFADFRYAEGGVPFSGPGCGELLVAGGHPHAPDCQTAGTLMADCVDEVPPAESFDLVVAAREGEPAGAVLELAPALPAVGDTVYVVGYPAFPWLPDEERSQLVPLYPFVSSGQVLLAEGRGIVVSAPAVGGNSGGPLLDAQGRVLGLLSTLVRHERARGTAVPADLLDHHAVAAAPDDRTREVVLQAQTPP